jgi:hypothetical protein
VKKESVLDSISAVRLAPKVGDEADERVDFTYCTVCDVTDHEACEIRQGMIDRNRTLVSVWSVCKAQSTHL